MLKIKDDVDLKELEKFGFERFNGYYVLFGNSKFEEIIQIFDSREIFINVQVYQDKFYQPYVDDKSVEKLISVVIDLVQAGLIEKVGVESE